MTFQVLRHLKVMATFPLKMSKSRNQQHLQRANRVLHRLSQRLNVSSRHPHHNLARSQQPERPCPPNGPHWHNGKHLLVARHNGPMVAVK